jgi:hypothetical protein
MQEEFVIPEVELGKVKPTIEFLDAVAATAAEGGINYWCVIKHYKNRESHFDACTRLRIDPETPRDLVASNRRDFKFAEMQIKPEGVDLVYVTPELVCKGLQKALTRPPEEGTHRASRIRQAIIEDDAGYLDAEDADCIFQYAVFDDIVYS